MSFRKQQGVSLIEVLIALLIFAVSIAVLVKFQSNLVQSQTSVNQRTLAVQIAESKLEELRHYSVLTTTVGYSAYEDIVSGSSSVVSPSTTYGVVWTVTDNASPPYKTLTVTVTWTDPSGVAQSVTLSSIVGQTDHTLSGTIVQGLP